MLPTHEAMEELDLIKEVMIQEAHVFGVPSVPKRYLTYYDLPAFHHHFVSTRRFETFQCLQNSIFNAKILCQKLFSLINHEFLINAHVYGFQGIKIAVSLMLQYMVLCMQVLPYCSCNVNRCLSSRCTCAALGRKCSVLCACQNCSNQPGDPVSCRRFRFQSSSQFWVQNYRF